MADDYMILVPVERAIDLRMDHVSNALWSIFRNKIATKSRVNDDRVWERTRL
jgi:hypothetical protein